MTTSKNLEKAVTGLLSMKNQIDYLISLIRQNKQKNQAYHLDPRMQRIKKLQKT